MKTLLKIAGSLLVLAAVALVAVYAWASVTSNRLLAQNYEVHEPDFPIPFPLDTGEIAALGLDADGAQRLAMDRAVERGRHLVGARYACTECHGPGFGGGTMVDAFPIGHLFGPNLTTGAGSRTLAYTSADWDRAVRHGVLPDGRPSVMPAEDFRLLSDQELSDIVAYIRSRPPVNDTVPPPSFGPLGKLLLAAGQLRLAASVTGSATSPHPTLPPVNTVASVELGAHIGATCTGCHGPDLAGGRIAGGDPSWPPARNLTPHPTALGSWSYTDFVSTLRGGIRPDGTPLRAPMTLVMPYAQQMSDVDLESLWMYLQSVPPAETPK